MKSVVCLGRDLLKQSLHHIQFRSSLCTSPAAMSKIPIYDVWSQPPEKSFSDLLPELARLMQQSNSPINKLLEINAGPKEVVQMMDDAGVSKVFLSAWSKPGQFVVTNEQVAKYTKAYPDRCIGIGTVNLTKPMAAVAEIDRCVKEYGFKGVRILPWLWNLPPTHNLYYPVFAKCVELGIPFCTQVGHTGPLCPSEPGRPIPYIDQVALDFPELKIVCGHIGYPWTDEMIGVAWKHSNVFIDTSAHAPKYYPPQLLHFMNSYGADKVMFGTNFPQLTWEACAKQAVDLPLKPKSMEKFLWKNAARVFNIEETVHEKSKL